jgi:hypothetical protein
MYPEQALPQFRDPGFYLSQLIVIQGHTSHKLLQTLIDLPAAKAG